MLPPTDPPEPTTTSATPPNDTAPAMAKRRLNASIPSAAEVSPVMIGRVPMISAVVVTPESRMA